jgi:hypothetical protein
VQLKRDFAKRDRAAVRHELAYGKISAPPAPRRVGIQRNRMTARTRVRASYRGSRMTFAAPKWPVRERGEAVSTFRTTRVNVLALHSGTRSSRLPPDAMLK